MENLVSDGIFIYATKNVAEFYHLSSIISYLYLWTNMFHTFGIYHSISIICYLLFMEIRSVVGFSSATKTVAGMYHFSLTIFFFSIYGNLVSSRV